MEVYKWVEVERGKKRVILEGKKILVVEVDNIWLVAFKARKTAMKKYMEDYEKFYALTVPFPEFRGDLVGVYPTGKEVRRVIAVGTEMFTPIPHTIIADLMREVLPDGEITMMQSYRTLIIWKKGNTGIVVAHKNTGRHALWVYTFVGSPLIPVGFFDRVKHAGNLEDVLERLKNAILRAYRYLGEHNVEEKVKEIEERYYDQTVISIVLGKLLKMAPDWFVHYFRDIVRMKKVKGKFLLETVRKAMEELDQMRVKNENLRKKLIDLVMLLQT